MNFKYIFFILTIISMTSCSSLINETKKESISFDAKKITLSNGLTVISVKNTKLPIFSYYTYYKVGGKYEEAGITGASHLLEHMMFKGAKKYGPGEFDRLVEGNGGKNNAYTTNDLTVYYESLPKEHFLKIVDLEADRMENLSLGEESFENERNVVLEERKMRYENSDQGKIYLQMMKEMFKGTPYGTSVIGTIPDLKSVTRDQIYNYFKKFYAPNNAVIIIVGDLNHSEVQTAIKQRFAKIPKTKNLEIIKKEILAKKDFNFKSKFNREVHLKGSSPNPLFNLSFKSVKVGTHDGFVLDILASILSDGGSSYLTQNFVLSKKPKLSQVYAGNHTLMNSGVFYIFGQALPGIKPAEIKKDLLVSLQRACNEAITEVNLKKIKNQYMVSMLDGLDTNAGIARFLGDHEVYYGSYKDYDRIMDIYEGITVSEVKDSCKKFLKKENSIFLSIWNKN